MHAKFLAQIEIEELTPEGMSVIRYRIYVVT